MPRRTYTELLRDKKWQKKRLEVFQRDDWTCTNCNCKTEEYQSLHIHHKRYIAGYDPADYDLEDLETLCEECHRKKHGIIDVSEYDLALDENDQVVSYDLKKLKKVGFSLKGYIEQDTEFFKYRGHFIIVHLSTNQAFKVFATKKLKAQIERLDSHHPDNGYRYYKVPNDMVAFYEAVHRRTGEMTLIAGQSHKALAFHEFED